MKTLGVALAASMLVASATAASAQSFTFEATEDGGATTVGGARPDGTSFGGRMWKGKSVADVGGRKISTTFTCVSLSQPPNDSIFPAHAVCDVTAPDGTYSLLMGCNFHNKEGTIVSCLGGSFGKTGSYVGKAGNMSLYTKAGKTTGTGQWFQ